MDPVSMAFTVVGWLMSSLVKKAVTALLEAWAKRIGLGNEFKTLKKQLLQLGALLTSARGLRTNNSFLEELFQDLQQLAYRAENLLDELDYYRLEDEIQQRGTQDCSIKSSVASSSSGFRLASRSILSTLKGMSCCSPYALAPLSKTFSSRINLSRRMNKLTEQLRKSEEIVRNAVKTEALVIIARNTEINQTEATNLHQTSSFLIEPNVFGRDQERDQLMNLLTNEESEIVGNKVPVLAIVGSGGVGKTTLAQLVFNDPKVQSYFEVRLWICVSTRFDRIRLTREMLEGACGNGYYQLNNLEELQKKLKGALVSKRFLLVLDDMWEAKDKSQWGLMVAPLNYCKVKGSIILVTTRNQSVAKMVDARDNISLHGLENDAFLSFFSTCIFNDPNYGGNWRLRNIGQQIANKLKGNPLAAKTVSALLREKLDERDWKKIRDSEEWKSQSGPDDIIPALRLSYEHMPFHLQRCFSYCAIFPEDHPFTCVELVYLWMAQGFLDIGSEGKRMEDIGSAYFNDLVNRGFFQTKQSTISGLVYYTFHDLIHDLACTVSFKECLSINGNEPRQIPTTIRHLSIFNSIEMGEEAIVRALACLEGENLSTIIYWDKLPLDTTESISDLLEKTKFLRSMRLKLGSMVQQHYFIQNFVSLRHLSLNFGIFLGSIDKIPGSIATTSYTLPSEICRLYHLEVFEIEDAWNLDELPNNFSDLISLRHFIVEGYLHSKIWGVGKLTSLQELNYFDVQQKIGFEIEQLGSLKEIGGSLQIRNLENVKSEGEANKATLAEKENLDDLYLRWNHGELENGSVLEGLKPNTNLKLLEIRGYGGVASPTWLDPSLIFLESLILESCKAWEQLPPIGELEFLKHLKLSGLATREIGPRCYGNHQSMKFPSLEELEIKDMPDLEKWVCSDQLQQFLCFKKLKDLTIEGCTKLVNLPLLGGSTSEVLERFPSLESLKIEDCPLILQLPPLPYRSLLSSISIARIETTKSRLYVRQRQNLTLILDQSSSLKVGERLSFHELSSLRSLEISNISSSESLDLHSCVALENLVIKGCQSLTSLTIGEHLVYLKIIDMPDLEKWVWNDQLQQSICFKKLEELIFKKCTKLVDLPLSGCATSEVMERFPSLKSLIIEDCPLIFQLPPLPYSSVLSDISIERTGFIKSMDYEKKLESLSLTLDQSSSLKVGELVTLHELTSLRYLKISNISSLESLDLHSFVALEELVIEGCQSLTSLTFGEHLVCLRILEIISCNTLSSMQGLKSWVNLERLHFRECPGFIAAWDSALKEIQRTEPDFSLSLRRIEGDSLALLTLPIYKQLTSLEDFELVVHAFTEEYEVSFQLLTSIDLVDIRGCKNLQSFPFDLFPSLKRMQIRFPRIQSLPTNSRTEIIEECEKLRNIEEVNIIQYPVKIYFKLSSEEKICQQMDAVN